MKSELQFNFDTNLYEVTFEYPSIVEKLDKMLPGWEKIISKKSVYYLSNKIIFSEETEEYMPIEADDYYDFEIPFYVKRESLKKQERLYSIPQPKKAGKKINEILDAESSIFYLSFPLSYE